jgi:hypothetical protein
MRALAAILDSRQDGFHDTADDQPEPMGHLANTLDPAENHIHRIRLSAAKPPKRLPPPEVST